MRRDLILICEQTRTYGPSFWRGWALVAAAAKPDSPAVRAALCASSLPGLLSSACSYVASTLTRMKSRCWHIDAHAVATDGAATLHE
eukprot:332953-Chlamydomonas_euryale.AAC.2